MEVSSFLKKVGVDPDMPVLLITAKESLENFLETIEEYCPHLEMDKMAKKDIEALLNSYGDCIINYHPENYHQERGALLKNFEMLQHYGLTDVDHNSIDFC